jgi:hypothetical protein
MSRQQLRAAERRDFWLYIDEFHNFITPSMAEILTGARKYRLGLVLAHQDLRQLHRSTEVASAVLSNPYTRVVFRVGDADARELERGFASYEARDMQNLPNYEAIARIERSDFDFNLSSPKPAMPDEAVADQRRLEVMAASRMRYAVPRAKLEEALRQTWTTEEPAPRPGQKSKARRSVSEVLPKADATPREGESKPEKDAPRPKQTPAPAATRTPPHPTPASGIGGEQHHIVHDRIKAAAHDLGYLATTEAKILDGQGKVDLLLQRSDRVIACEISVTTTIDHEVGNIAKCLEAGFPLVAMIGVDARKLQEIEKAAKTSLGEAAVSRVAYYLPDDFLKCLGDEPQPPSQPQAPPPSGPVVRRGYNVKRSYVSLSPEEHSARETVGLKAIAEAMREKQSTVRS